MDERDEIRSRINLVDLVGQHVRLKRRRNEWVGLCPFHDDKNPSFSVSETSGTYRCWSCSKHGDIFTWVMETQHVEFYEALQILAEQAGVELKRGKRQDPEKRDASEAAMSHALVFFQEHLRKNKLALDYCESRSLDATVQQTWELGYAPDEEIALPTSLKNANLPLAVARELFLVEGSPSSGYIGKFRGRLIFPIRDERGRLVAFGGRILHSGQPKYINSSDTPIYRKSRVLYGMFQAKETIQTQNAVVLCEGYLDVIACHRAGITNAVASLGTALSEDQAKLMKRWCDRVIILYDGDNAGIKAANRACEILTTAGLKVRICQVREGNDPDTILRDKGAEALVKVVESAYTLLEHTIRTMLEEDGEKDAPFWSKIAEMLAKVSPLERERFVMELAPQYPGIRDSALAQRALRELIGSFVKTKRDKAPPRFAVTHRVKSEMSGPELAVLLAATNESLRPTVWQLLTSEPHLMTSPPAVELSEALCTHFPTPPEGDFRVWSHKFESDELVGRFVLLFDSAIYTVSAEILEDAINKLRKSSLDRAVTNLRNTDLNDPKTLYEISEKLRTLKDAEVADNLFIE